MSKTDDTAKAEIIAYLETASGINTILRNRLLSLLSEEPQEANPMSMFRTLTFYPRMGHMEPQVQETLKAYITQREIFANAI